MSKKDRSNQPSGHGTPAVPGQPPVDPADGLPPADPADPASSGSAVAGQPERMVTVTVVKQSISHGGVITREGDTVTMTAAEAQAYGKDYVRPAGKQKLPAADKQVTGSKNK